MNKEEFLFQLKKKLTGLSEKDINKSLDYYSEMIDDSMEDGLNEQEAIEKLGSVEDISSQILKDIPLPKLIKAKVKPSNSLKTGEIILLIIGSPLWILMLFLALLLFFILYILIWTFVLVVYAVFITFACGAIAALLNGFLLIFSSDSLQALFSFGLGLFCLGITILMFLFSYFITFKMIQLSKKILLKIKLSFLRKENGK